MPRRGASASTDRPGAGGSKSVPAAWWLKSSPHGDRYVVAQIETGKRLPEPRVALAAPLNLVDELLAVPEVRQQILQRACSDIAQFLVGLSEVQQRLNDIQRLWNGRTHEVVHARPS